MDDRLDILPVPYALYEHVHAEPLGLLHREPEEVAHAWRELGRDTGEAARGHRAAPVDAEWSRVKRGELRAVHVCRGRRKGLRIEVPLRADDLFAALPGTTGAV